MRAILIDPIARTISNVQHNGDYKQIYELLSDKDNGLDVDDFNAVQWDERNTVYVDGEGLLKSPRYFFILRGYQQPLAGRGLILGVDRMGETIATSLTVEQVIPHVRYEQLSVQGFVHDEGVADHPLLGPDTPFIRQTPVFGPPDDEEAK